MRRRHVFIAALAVAMLALCVARARGASAHPLGNFTINHYDRVEVSDTGIEAYSVLDMAEIPTFQERQKIDSNGDGNVDDAEAAAYATAKADDLRKNLRLTINGAPAALSEVSHALTFPPGQGGLRLLRLTATYRASLPRDWRSSPPKVEFEDTNYPDRLGWREIVARNASGVVLINPTVPSQDVSGELKAYPTDALSSPLNVRTATFSFRPDLDASASPAPDLQGRAVQGNPDSPLVRFANLVSKDRLTPGVIVLALLAAMGFGALHALSPGHGKTVVGAYLVGSRGTAKHALLLGLVVTATHTSTVYLLGFVTLYLSGYIVPEKLYPWLGVASGGLIVLMGVTLFAGRLLSSGLLRDGMAWLRSAERRNCGLPAAGRQFVFAGGEVGALFTAAPAQARREPVITVDTEGGIDRADIQDHHHDGADSSGPHKHGRGPAHSHALPVAGKLSIRQLVGLGIFGGILPCPSAIVVMLSAVALHRVGFGLVLIVAFSVGLAGVLTVIGLAMVYAPAISRRLPIIAAMAGRAGRSQTVSSIVVRTFPIVAAAAVTGAGTVILLRAMSQL